MPVDTFITDAMLGTFRNMLQECRDKNLSGDDFNALDAALARMEQLGAEMDDTAAYSGMLVQEGLFIKFSDHYSKLLSSAAEQASANDTGGYDETADCQLLQNTLQAYREAVKNIRTHKAEVKQIMGDHATDADMLFKDQLISNAIEAVINLGESGISYPQFLTQLNEQGLDKALEGSVITRQGLQYSIDAAKATSANPFYVKKEMEKLSLHDGLTDTSVHKIADSLQFQLGCEKIDWTYEPDIRKWNKIKQGWERSVFLLDEWITAYCSFAPHIEPWAAAKDPKEAVTESQDCVPGQLRVWQQINQRYFGMSIQQLFGHPSFNWDVEYHWMHWSQEYLEFLFFQVEPVCQPSQQPDTHLIFIAEKMHKENRKFNPNINLPTKRFASFFDDYFGEGEFAKRYGMPAKPDSNAAVWSNKNLFTGI
ncbi:MAG: hypothetical protein IPL84_05510 [Chitinophagaceae bacterium]|nr:hypothetical protein [Chitinophagaceae bacterium]